MEIKHKEIIESILNKEVKNRKEWEHQFLLKHKFENDVRRYLLSMGEFKDVEIKMDNKKELIKELEGIRIRLTQIYIELGNPGYVRADSILIGDIQKLKDKTSPEEVQE